MSLKLFVAIKLVNHDQTIDFELLIGSLSYIIVEIVDFGFYIYGNFSLVSNIRLNFIAIVYL
jgi:hypothetical protein